MSEKDESEQKLKERKKGREEGQKTEEYVNKRED